MKAVVYHGPGERGWDTVDDPAILDPTDAIVRIDTSTKVGIHDAYPAKSGVCHRCVRPYPTGVRAARFRL
jgi:hypothetical protein